MATTKVILQMPIIEADTVRFEWSVLPERGDLPGGELVYRYEGIDLSQFSPQLWMEVWLSLTLREFLEFGDEIEIRLPVPAASSTIQFWLAYYGLTGITIGPETGSIAYHPFQPERKPDPGQSFTAGVFFGGGRDSSATSGLLGEIYGPEQILLMTVIDPTKPGPERRQQVSDRYERLLFAPVRKEGFTVQPVYSTLHARRKPFGPGSREPHLEQYTAGLLPVLLARGVKLSTFCFAWFGYVIQHQGDEIRFRFPRSRPEVLAAQSRHYQRALGFSHDVANVNLALSDLLVMRLLHERYPERFPNILMCPHTRDGGRWCYNCDNCAFYCLHLLALSVHDPRFDYSRLLTESRWIKGIVRAIEAMKSPPPPGMNAPYIPEIADPLGFSEFWCNAFALADPEFVRSVCNEDAWFNLMLVKAFYGNRYESAWETSHPKAFEILPGDLGPRLRAIVEQYQPIVAGLPILDAGGVAVEGPFSREFSPAVAALPYLR